MTESEYTKYVKPVDDFLSDRGVHFSTQLIGDDCPLFCEDRNEPGIGLFPRKNHVHGQHWLIGFTRRESVLEEFCIDYWDSYRDAEYSWLRVHWRECTSEETLRRHGVDPDRMTQPKLRGERRPSAYDVLSCVTKYDPGTFEDWCGELDLDTDSRRAEATHRAVVDEFRRFAAFFTADEILTLQEVAQ